MTINQNKVLNEVTAYMNPNKQHQYHQKRRLISSLLTDFMELLAETRDIYNQEPDLLFCTIKMNDSFMLKIPKKQRAPVIEDITFELIKRLNNYLIKHPERACNQQYKVRPFISIENRDGQGNAVIEHSHSILMLNPFHRKRDDLDHSNLQYLALRIIAEAGPFQTLTDNHTVHLISDCHSIKIDPLAASEDVEKTLGYLLKTATLSDDQNLFAVLNNNSMEKFYETKNAQRQSAHAQIA